MQILKRAFFFVLKIGYVDQFFRSIDEDQYVKRLCFDFTWIRQRCLLLRRMWWHSQIFVMPQTTRLHNNWVSLIWNYPATIAQWKIEKPLWSVLTSQTIQLKNSTLPIISTFLRITCNTDAHKIDIVAYYHFLFLNGDIFVNDLSHLFHLAHYTN